MSIPSTIPPSVKIPQSYFAPVAELRRRLSPVDYLDITDLVVRFEWCFDTRNFDALADMITEDFIVDHVWGYAEGRDACIQLLRENLLGCIGLRHQATNLTVWGEPDGTAVACSYILGVVVGDAEDNCRVHGPVYRGAAGHGLVTDRFKRGGDDIWRMTRRTIDQMYTDPGFLSNEEKRRSFALDADARRLERRKL